MIPVARPSFGPEEERLVVEVLRSGWVTQGPRVQEFEQRFAQRVGAAEAVAVSSATTALFLVLHALGIGPGDEVLVPSLSFIASANCIAHAGATPVFCDVDPRTYCLDPAPLAAAITPRTRAILAVHQLGMPADLAALEAVAREHRLHLVEDAACAVGSRLRGEEIGGSGRPVCFSFHPRKVLVTGEGGMITTGDAELAARLRRLRHQGMSVSDLERHRSTRPVIESYPEIGYNFRMSDVHAALGLAQLAKLDGFLAERRRLARRYDAAFASHGRIVAPHVPAGAEPSYQSYIVRIAGASRGERDGVIEAMAERGVATRRGLMASHLEPCYAGARTAGDLALTVEACEETLVLPMFQGLTEADQDVVAAALNEVVRA